MGNNQNIVFFPAPSLPDVHGPVVAIMTQIGEALQTLSALTKTIQDQPIDSDLKMALIRDVQTIVVKTCSLNLQLIEGIPQSAQFITEINEMIELVRNC